MQNCVCSTFTVLLKVQLCLSLIPLYSKNIECFVKNNLFHNIFVDFKINSTNKIKLYNYPTLRT